MFRFEFKLLGPFAAVFVFLGIGSAGLGSDLSFEAVDDEVTQLAAIMQSWHDQELTRQGGKFKSHGWWRHGNNQAKCRNNCRADKVIDANTFVRGITYS